jgi:Ca2+/Na+ antiporter
MYCFLGISLATQNYINPSIDTIKEKGVLSSESMNATLLAMTNSAAESFIIMNSIFFGVSDIGISTVVQQAAFYSLIIQGIFYLIVPAYTLIDWWIITRETVFIFFYLVILTYCLMGNRVDLAYAVTLFILYIVHIFLMKYSSKYEVAIKQSLANSMEQKELAKIAKKDISRFHMNLKTNAISIEMLNRVKFKLRNNYIILEDSLIKKKLKMSNCIKRGEEVFADKDDKALSARRAWKEAV